MIVRAEVESRLNLALKRSRVTALVGPRQCGKTTLARRIVPPDSLNYFDLEDPESLARLQEPMTSLKDLHGIVVIDEIQRRQDLFPVLRVLADRQKAPARFLILGSASPALMKQSSESLAGRLETVPMEGFSLKEIGISHYQRHLLRGGFPLSYLAHTDEDSSAWRKNFIQTFLERDIPQAGFNIPAATLFRFWTMLAHYHGQIWNAAEIARSLGISQTTARRYVDLLDGLFMVRQLQPWYANTGKRQIKAPKIYLRDSGLLHQLLGIRSDKELFSHPKCGASWEGYAIEEILKTILPDQAYFWGTHNGAELDLFIIKDGLKVGFEVKRTDSPHITPSMKIAMQDLKLDALFFIYPGDKSFSLGKRITAMPLWNLISSGKNLNSLVNGND